MTLWNEIGTGLAHAAAYVGTAVVVLVVGYLVTDALTPGRLSRRILTDRDPNVTVIAATNLAAAGMVVFSAIYGTRDDFVDGLVSTAVFGLVGVVLLAVADLVIDLLTPGRLYDVLSAPAEGTAVLHPGVWFIGTAHLVIGAIVAVSIS